MYQIFVEFPRSALSRRLHSLWTDYVVSSILHLLRLVSHWLAWEKWFCMSDGFMLLNRSLQSILLTWVQPMVSSQWHHGASSLVLWAIKAQEGSICTGCNFQ